jgi:2-oxoglutarate ferredoxin oxidoreductase subunit beta
VFSPCVTYNKVNTYDWFKEHLINLNEIEGYDTSSREMAMETLIEHESLVKGIVYQDKERPSYQDLANGYAEQSLAYSDIELHPSHFNKLMREFM